MARLLGCVEELGAGERQGILDAAGIADDRLRLIALDDDARTRLASALRAAI